MELTSQGSRRRFEVNFQLQRFDENLLSIKCYQVISFGHLALISLSLSEFNRLLTAARHS